MGSIVSSLLPRVSCDNRLWVAADTGVVVSVAAKHGHVCVSEERAVSWCEGEQRVRETGVLVQAADGSRRSPVERRWKAIDGGGTYDLDDEVKHQHDRLPDQHATRVVKFVGFEGEEQHRHGQIRAVEPPVEVDQNLKRQVGPHGLIEVALHVRHGGDGQTRRLSRRRRRKVVARAPTRECTPRYARACLLGERRFKTSTCYNPAGDLENCRHGSINLQTGESAGARPLSACHSGCVRRLPSVHDHTIPTGATCWRGCECVQHTLFSTGEPHTPADRCGAASRGSPAAAAHAPPNSAQARTSVGDLPSCRGAYQTPKRRPRQARPPARARAAARRRATSLSSSISTSSRPALSPT
mmetsp:Transcript_15250/g.40223  ORF Transcript_15250/g.40223 Transcript_15250/m.40223 type:complete len:355 (-) Transcript_15250:489-1553(-)